MTVGYLCERGLPKEHASLLWPSGSMEPVIPTLAICSLQFVLNRIGGIMVSVLALSAVGHGLSSSWVKPKTMKLVFVASPLST